MHSHLQPWQILLAALAGWVNRKTSLHPVWR